MIVERAKFITVQYLYVIIAIKTRNSYLKVKSNITCPVKVGHPPAPRDPAPFPQRRLSSASRLSPLPTPTPQHSLCRNIFLFMCKQKSHLFKFSHEFA